MDKDVLRSVLGDDEAETFLGIEPLDSSLLSGEESKARGVDAGGLLPETGAEQVKHGRVKVTNAQVFLCVSEKLM